MDRGSWAESDERENQMRLIIETEKNSRVLYGSVVGRVSEERPLDRGPFQEVCLLWKSRDPELTFYGGRVYPKETERIC